MSEQESLPPQTPYEILGDQGIKALVKAFYEVMDTHPAAKEIRAMHAENLEPVKSKLVSFLVGWMGGPPVYLAVTGTVCLTDPHAAFHIGPRQTEQWLLCMDEALIKVNASQELKEMFKTANGAHRQHGTQSRYLDPAPRDPNLIAVGR